MSLGKKEGTTKTEIGHSHTQDTAVDWGMPTGKDAPPFTGEGSIVIHTISYPDLTLTCEHSVIICAGQ